MTAHRCMRKGEAFYFRYCEGSSKMFPGQASKLSNCILEVAMDACLLVMLYDKIATDREAQYSPKVAMITLDQDRPLHSIFPCPLTAADLPVQSTISHIQKGYHLMTKV